MNTKEILTLLELIDQFDVEEFELERAGTRLRICRPVTQLTSSPQIATIEEVSPVEVTLSESKQHEDGQQGLHIFTAPIVGTYYSAPKPDADPFIQVGEPIQEGDILCVIEAMKIFNQIESDLDGEIVRILVENGQPVEYGEPLFEIRPNS